MIQEGQAAPDFRGHTAEGREIALADFRGRGPLVLYFYPRDNTPGCTKEACGFRDARADVEAAGAEIVGVSMDGADSHRKFAADHRLNFPLISDPDGTIANAYGVARLGGWLKFLPPRRVTFVIDRGGIVRRVIASELNMDSHVDGAIATLRGLR